MSSKASLIRSDFVEGCIFSDKPTETLPLLFPSGLKKAPGVDGSETMSKQINWKSSSTIVTPLASITAPSHLDEMPSFTPEFINAFKTLPDGVSNTSILPMTLSPSHHILLTKCEAFFRLITESSG